jgi:hypothetical protein
MSFEDVLQKALGEVTVRDLQRFQEVYDARFVDQKFHGSDEKIRHTALHLAKALAKVARYAERREHGEECSIREIADEVVPDLMVYAFWLAGESGTEPARAYLRRMVGNIERLYEDKCSAEELARLKELADGME